MSEGERPISRVNRSKQDARRSYDRLSGIYDLLSGTSEWRFVQIGLDQLQAAPGEKILEIGFGTGRAMCKLAEAVGDSGTVDGLDISPGMRSVAMRRLESAGVSERVRLECGDAARLPYQDQIFDALFMSFTLELFDTSEIGIVLNESRRVLRPGGRIAIVAMLKTERENLMTWMYAAAHRWIERFADCRPIYPEQELLRAGFQIREVQQHRMWGLPVAVVLAESPVG